MEEQNHLLKWLDHLYQLSPPTGVMCVGAGNGDSGWVDRLQTWDAQNVTLVEADETQFTRLEKNPVVSQLWQLRNEVVAERSESVLYHQATLASESGLVDPESLQTVWPNIRVKYRKNRQALALAELLSDSPSNWLWIDCLPALNLLRGAGDALLGVDLVMARILLNPPEVLAELGLSSLQAFLEARGLRRLCIEESRNPGIGLVLFTRDTQFVIKSLHHKVGHLESQLQHAIEVKEWVEATSQQQQQQILQLETRLKETADKAIDAKCRHKDLLMRAEHAECLVSEQASKLDSTRERLDKMYAEHDSLVQSQQELQTELTQLRAEREQTQQALLQQSTLLASIQEEHIQRLDEVIAQSEKLKGLLSEGGVENNRVRQALHKKAVELRTAQARSDQLEENLHQQQHINKQLTVEITRAQAQIDLIEGLEITDQRPL
ncbi:hypothetical protein [Comamonas aquatilis]|uniref:hypothetical protein n=1 Tax=Comamonas aquatilis TaxID=1778406 RepID=UPI0039F1002B